ncbi:sphingomyelin phosphodiesterase-like [Euwallacea fornicatus]|uniref:sphingomyelin phosphodiesterase-like n=1 Tax=Euwallacea fornicatus TaxID=995702 RepID=UPI00338E4C0E
MLLKVFAICFLLCVNSVYSTSDNHETIETIKRGFDEYLQTGIRPGYLNRALSHFQLPHFFRNDEVNIELYNMNDADTCSLCSVVSNFLVIERKLGMSSTKIKAEVQEICESFDIESSRVCAGFIDLNADLILYIIDNTPDLEPTKFCDIFLQGFSCNFTNIEWSVEIPEGQTPERPQPGDSSSTINILHISDVHLDPLYTPNKVKTCHEPLCCQNDQDDGVEGNSCGYWAEYGNDVSENFVDEFIRFANTLDLDYVYFTGDIISHRVWDTSREKNSEVIEKFLKKLKSGFKVPVYPVLGNHETNPLNQYVMNDLVPSNFSTRWLFDLIKEDWAQWLPNSAMETIEKGGFYTVSPREGLRLVVLNSNVAYKDCWWLLQDDKDPFDELAWLVDVLKDAEDNNESVHILGHIPVGSVSMLKVWAREYNRIVNRFANTITGQFNGHVHVDTFQVHYNLSDPEQAINVGWNGASLVPYDQANPSFKIYHVDKDAFNVIEIDQWTFNLTQANENSEKEPEWYKIYSFRDAFNVETLRPKDVGNLLISMAKNHTQLEEYHLFRYKNSDSAAESGCDENCQKGYLCEFSTSVYGSTEKCKQLKKIYDENL